MYSNKKNRLLLEYIKQKQQKWVVDDITKNNGSVNAHPWNHSIWGTKKRQTLTPLISEIFPDIRIKNIIFSTSTVEERRVGFWWRKKKE